MYKIYADGVAIHDTSTRDSQVVSPNLDLEDSMAGSLEFTIPVSHPYYGKIRRLTTNIKVYQDDILIFSGRVTEEKKDFTKNISYYCEGDLALLNDTTQPQAEYHNMTVRGFLETLINIHNSKVENEKQFRVGVVTVTDSNDSIYRYTNRENTLECIKDKLLDRFGGHIRVTIEEGIRYIDYLADYPNTNEQVIRFGENLLDYTSDLNMADLYTVIIPLGERLKESPIEGLDAYLDITSVNDGKDYLVNSEAVSMFGWIEHVEHFDGITVPANLKAKGQAMLNSIHYEEMVLEISAVDLHDLNINTEAIKLLDKIRVISEPHGLDAYFPVTKISIPLDNPADKKFTLGVKSTESLTDTQTSEMKAVTSKIDDNYTAAEQQISGKQDELTPGANITIDENNVISATGVQDVLDAGTNINLTELLSGHTRIDALPSIGTLEYWLEHDGVSEDGAMYVYSDYKIYGSKNVPGMKLGDGETLISELPFLDVIYANHIIDTIVHVTSSEKEFWNNKVTCFIDPLAADRMVFSKE